MNPLRRRSNPLLLEIATRPWLARLAEEAGRPILLSDVPDSRLDAIAQAGFDAVWLMGAWTTGPKARALAMRYPDLLATYDRLLPGWTEDDIAGSAYSIAAYEPPDGTGGRDGLRDLRRRLHERGLGLVLDFVPNHLGIDHPWLDERPELLMQGTDEDLAREPANWFRHASRDGTVRVFGHGRDPHFPGWSDTVQIDHRRRAARQAMTEVFADLASLADGLRCDVAMLLLDDILRSTWGEGDGSERGDFWSEAIPVVRAQYPELALIAEAYWHTGDRLLDAGFDWAYDKETLDQIIAGDPAEIRDAVARDSAYHARRCHFLENHDEERAWAVLGPERSAAAAALLYTLPGLRFFQEGQVEGHRERTPVQMRRAPDQPRDPAARRLYDPLLKVLRDPVLDQGEWSSLRFEAVDDGSADGLVGSQWKGPDRLILATANFGDGPGRGRVLLPLHPDGPAVRIRDELTGEHFERSRKELTEVGLFVEVPSGGAHLFVVPLQPATGR